MTTYNLIIIFKGNKYYEHKSFSKIQFIHHQINKIFGKGKMILFIELFATSTSFTLIFLGTYWNLIWVLFFSLPQKSDYAFPPLLWREIPMPWGITTDSLTPEINPFQYAREIKCLTLKDQTSYLILESWSRSPLSFPTSYWIDESLPQQQVNKTKILYILVLDLL